MSAGKNSPPPETPFRFSPVAHAGRADLRLVASGLGDGDTGGGLFVLGAAGFETIDRLSTTGLAVSGRRLFRSLHTTADGVGEIFTYDESGIERYCRVDSLGDPHDLLWDGRQFLAVSSSGNCVLWLSESGRLIRTWRAPGEDDSWHLNGLLEHEGSLLACAFGRYERHREWKDRLLAGDGVVFELESGRDVLTGLCCPHNPRYFDGAWTICNSALRELLQIDPVTLSVRRRAALRSFTRGLAVSDDFVFVGESANRTIETGLTATVAVLDRRTWELVARFTLPCREVYDLVLAPAALVEGLKAGFRTNPLRTSEQDQWLFFDRLGISPQRIWPTGDPLPAEHCRVRLAACVPPRMEAGASIQARCEISNLSEAFLVSIPPNPVHVSYHWHSASGEVIEGIRTVLPRAVQPQGVLPVQVRLNAPTKPGAYELRLSLVQEAVAWFDQLDPANGCILPVEVEPQNGPGGTQCRPGRED